MNSIKYTQLTDSIGTFGGGSSSGRVENKTSSSSSIFGNNAYNSRTNRTDSLATPHKNDSIFLQPRSGHTRGFGGGYGYQNTSRFGEIRGKNYGDHFGGEYRHHGHHHQHKEQYNILEQPKKSFLGKLFGGLLGGLAGFFIGSAIDRSADNKNQMIRRYQDLQSYDNRA